MYRKYLPSLLVVMGAIGVSSCGHSNAASTAEMPAMKTSFILLKQGNADTHKNYPGLMEGVVNVTVKPQVTGYLESVLVKEGDYVQKGQVLFKIKPEVYTEQVNSSNATLKAALAAEANARLEVEKLKPLVAGKVITEIQLQTAQANLNAASAQVEQAKAALGSSKINADFTLVKAPVNGYIGRIPNRLGNLVSPGDQVALTTLSDISTVFVYFSISEADFISYKKSGVIGDGKTNNISLILADGSAYDHAGTLETASGNIDQTTGSISMKGIFPNPDKLLRAGGAAKVVINSTLNNVIQLPIASVKDIQDKLFVFRLAANNRVSMIPITIQGSTPHTYFVKDGLQPGDKVAINRLDMLQDSMQVMPEINTGDSVHLSK
ncbi:efflux RND transporter periplasmic adaptor subunit [Chitinophaga sp. Cy-1792]|uniref:efflux RND transporter periplasmic adaptor subunit n=1 Tax=Chitinophaga sp. Cy-1792 TaxID=2608339 RepID=UPI00141E113E|nr:efflux RND transporter periplasmic adaptor subunit [Chitinophaga sp. Cy-1792]NIG55073.1 efflux RND transporter periplasmic adaptor subunit [Chitinophaga sp. Cy-1792]